MKEEQLKTGSGKKVTSCKQAIAIGRSPAREAGAAIPEKVVRRKVAAINRVNKHNGCRNQQQFSRIGEANPLRNQNSFTSLYQVKNT